MRLRRLLARPVTRVCLALALGGQLLGCSSATPAPTSPGDQLPQRSPSVLPEVVVSPFEDAQLAADLQTANALLLSGKPRDALPLYDRLLRLAPEGPTAAPALVNGGIAMEDFGEREAALGRYKQALERFPQSDAARIALLRSMRAQAHVERWADLQASADRVLALADLKLLETIEARGFRALALVELGKTEDAAKDVDKALTLAEQSELGKAGKPPIELAPAFFAQGEVRRARSEAITFLPFPPNFLDVLEKRCQGLLDAQNAYVDAMRARDAHWSAMAGFRVGQLYQVLHADVMKIPAPPKAKTEKERQLFEGAIRLRYRVLLEKGLKMMAGTVQMAERTGEVSTWVSRAEKAKADLELAIAEEKAALAKLPFTEQQLQQELDKLKKP